ncbi:MAG: hydrogenase nickel incorporation protein HypB [Burkholderiaceae bacterium]|nr:hydrogenase nickel incorporation protein HypB [Burkholderiaceae bacterium]
MCTVCGCGKGETRIDGGELHTHADGTTHSHVHGVADHDHGHDQGHAHDHVHGHDHGPAAQGDLHYGHGAAHSHAPGLSQERMVTIERNILDKNNTFARGNRRQFEERGIFALNLVSSPGSGKTTLLVETIKRLAGDLPLAVIEGDQQTTNDAERIRATGTRAVQINTGKGCHLDASQVEHALSHLDPADDSVLFIENVGNLVCPSAFDLGEAHKVVVLSVTEGEDKPLKYPDMFAAASLMVLNKVDLLPYLEFDVNKAIEAARRVNPAIAVLQVSATKGLGMDAWLDWIRAGAEAAAAHRAELAQLKSKRLALLEEHIASLR